jgi:lysophospholipase L1-like esterase
MSDTLASVHVTRVDRLRSIAKVAGGTLGIGAGVAAGGFAALAGVMWGESKLAKRRIPISADPPPVSDDLTWAAAGVSPSRPPIQFAMAGDSSAAGYGAYRLRDTPAAQFAISISEVARRPVHVRNVAVVGAESKDLEGQVDALLGHPPELVVIMIGANDVTESTKPSVAATFLETAVRRLRAAGSQVVVGTCPDLGVIEPIAQPLRSWARRQSRNMARAQTEAVVRAGGTTVSLGDLLGPVFATRRDLFSDDRFHPSAAGYLVATQAMLPSALDALGVHTRARSASAFTTRRAKPLAKAAAQAVARPGSEVRPTDDRPVTAVRANGTWARLRRRGPRHPAPPHVEAATPVTPATAG